MFQYFLSRIRYQYSLIEENVAILLVKEKVSIFLIKELFFKVIRQPKNMTILRKQLQAEGVIRITR